MSKSQKQNKFGLKKLQKDYIRISFCRIVQTLAPTQCKNKQSEDYCLSLGVLDGVCDQWPTDPSSTYSSLSPSEYGSPSMTLNRDKHLTEDEWMIFRLRVGPRVLLVQ